MIRKMVDEGWCLEFWKWKLKYVPLFGIPWTVACQAPLSMKFSRQEHWGGLPFPSPGDLPDPGIEPRSSALQANTPTYITIEKAKKA